MRRWTSRTSPLIEVRSLHARLRDPWIIVERYVRWLVLKDSVVGPVEHSTFRRYCDGEGYGDGFALR
jgi:hypothetical protein